MTAERVTDERLAEIVALSELNGTAHYLSKTEQRELCRELQFRRSPTNRAPQEAVPWAPWSAGDALPESYPDRLYRTWRLWGGKRVWEDSYPENFERLGVFCYWPVALPPRGLPDAFTP